MGIGVAERCFYQLCNLVRVVASHSSVPVLSVISGWLFIRSFKVSYKQMLRSKVKTLIVPMVTWNILMLVIYLGSSMVFHIKWDFPNSAIGIANAFLSINDRPLINPLYFLRDIFVCANVTYLIIRLEARYGNSLILIAFALGCAFSVVLPESIILQRAVILPTFLFGAIVAKSNRNVMAHDFVPGLTAISALFVVTIVQSVRSYLPGINPYLDNALELALRFCLATIGWFVIKRLSTGKAGQELSRLEPYIFFVFCSHFVLFMVASAALKRAHIPADSTVALLMFLVSPLFALAAGIIGYEALRRAAPSVLGILTGGRVKKALAKNAVRRSVSATNSAT